MTVYAHEDLQQRQQEFINVEETPDVQWQDAEQNGESDISARRSRAHDDSVQLYLREIGQVALLTADDEISLAQQIERGLAAQKQLGSHAELTASERLALHRDVLQSEEARRQIIQANLRLVVSIAKKYINSPLSFMDLIQEGNIGLMKAVEKYDYQRGHRFSTYATWWIRQAITRAIAEQSRLIRLPVHLSEAIGQLRRTARQLEQALEREPSSQELADALNMSEQKVRRLLQASAQPISLEQPLNTDGEGHVRDVLSDEEQDVPLRMAAQRMLKEEIIQALAALPERERQVLRLRYGLEDGRRHTLEEVGSTFGITRERTRQIEAEALRHLRRPSIGAGLQAYLE